MAAAAVRLEKELTCSICTDVLFDPITYLDCLHTNCGACSKSWFASKPIPTCPVCRQTVRDVKPNTTISGILESFLFMHPEKKRSEEEEKAARDIYRPGDRMLDQQGAFPGINAVFGMDAPRAGPSNLPTLAAPPMQVPRAPRLMRQAPHELMIRQDGSLDMIPPALSWSNAPWVGAPWEEFPDVGDLTAGGISPLLFQHQQLVQRLLSHQHSPTQVRHPGPGVPPTPAPALRTSNRRTPSGPNTIGDLLMTDPNDPIAITCDHCHNTVGNALHYECTGCSMFHVCVSCSRNGKTCPSGPSLRHTLLPQKLIPASASSFTNQHLQTGIFCSICTAWTDEDRNLRSVVPRSLFWHCEVCHDGNWVYCQSCVHRGRCCSHTLSLWTNNRVNSSTNILKGRSHASAAVILSENGMSNGREWLRRSGYQRWTAYQLTCDGCFSTIPPSADWWHCVECPNDWDQCMECARTGVCHQGRDGSNHKMVRFRRIGQEQGVIKVTVPVKVEKPELVTIIRGRSEGNAKAIRGFWEGGVEEGGSMLGFPKGADVANVSEAYRDEEGVRWYWGIYAGVGGLFPESVVRLG